MTVASPALSQLEPAPDELTGRLPPAEHLFAPRTLEEAAQVLDAASEEGATVLVWGGGEHQGYGGRVDADVVVSTQRLDRVVAWEPDDLTLVVEAGMHVAQVEEMLGSKRQTAGLPEVPGAATVGGVVAAGISGYRRARYGPIRDRVLEVTLVTGDGRVVKGGGRVVKNVSGYDLPRLATGSLGRLGLIGVICLKLWPLPEAQATVSVDDPAAAWRRLYRPLAVLETNEGSFAYLQGVSEDVRSQAERLGGEWSPSLEWPTTPGGRLRLELRVPPTFLREGLTRVRDRWRFLAEHGVGTIWLATDDPVDLAEIEDLRGWAERVGGAFVMAGAPADLYQQIDPWGSPPPSLELQRRLVAGFDPVGVVNPGRLPGGL